MKRNAHALAIAALVLLTALAAAALALNARQTQASGLAQDAETPQPTEATETALTETPAPTATTAPTETPLPSPTYTLYAPTRVPPTPLPPQATASPAAQIDESALARVQESGTLRIGTYYNASPFVWLNERGELDGYEAAIARAIAVELGVEIEFVQVLRHNDTETLLSGEVDLLIGQQTRSRDREAVLDFTHPYYMNEVRMVIRQGEPYAALAQLSGHPIGVEIGSRSERALRLWADAHGVTFDIRTYYSEAEALDALAAGEVDGAVGQLDSLRRAGRQQMSLVSEPIMQEPYAIALRLWDENLRKLLNRSIQRLKASGRLEQIYADWFGNEAMDFVALVPVYDDLYEDARGLGDFASDLPRPDSSLRDRLLSGGTLRVAGVVADGQDAPAERRLTNALNRALVEEMARRWGVTLDFVPDTAADPAAAVAEGRADLAVAVAPTWDGSDSVDFSLPYLQHSDRLVVPANSDLGGFQDMLGTNWIIGYFSDDPDGEAQVQKYADYFNVGQNIRTFEILRENEAIYTMTVEDNISAIFGDSLRLQALMREGDADSVKMLPDVFDLQPITFALPRNDSPFRALVNDTLQDMTQDGTFRTLWQTHLNLGDPVTIPIWPEHSAMRAEDAAAADPAAGAATEPPAAANAEPAATPTATEIPAQG